jgi:multidrug efflux pump subunit AcrB
MRLPDFAIRNHQFTVVIITLLVLSGMVSFFTMPRSEDPQITSPGTTVTVTYPGAAPVDIEQTVIFPLEEAVNELTDIRRITSTSADGWASIAVEFEFRADVDELYNELVQKVNEVRNDLPDGITDITTTKWVFSDFVKILQLALISETASYREMEVQGDRLKRRLERVQGVKRVDLRAIPEQEVRIAADIEKMAQLGISLNSLLQIIQANNTSIPGGSLDLGGKRFTIQTSGSYRTLGDIRNTIVTADGNAIVYLKDIADVYFDYEDNNYFARFNGERTIFITASQKEGTNIYRVMGDVRRVVDEFETELPESMRLEYVFNQEESVRGRMSGFFMNLIYGIILVGTITLLVLGFRISSIVIIVIPISIFIAIGFLDLSGYGLEQMTIAGLVISLGLLVDNAIVTTENIARFRRLGYDGTEAAAKGTQQIGWAIVSATATTILAFVPLVLMYNISGDYIRGMPVTVIYTLAASLFVALTLTPYLSSKFIKDGRAPEGTMHRAVRRLIETKYRSRLDFALRRPVFVLIIATIIFTGSLALFPLVGISFFPMAEKPQFMINIDLPDGSSLERTDRAARYVESILVSRDEVKLYATNVGRGNPQIYYNIMSHRGASSHAQIFVELHDYDAQLQARLIHELRDQFDLYPGARIELREFEQGPPVEAPVAIRVTGENLEVLREVARDVEAIIARTPGTVNVNNPLATVKTDLHVNIHREKAGMLGVAMVDIDRTVRAGMAGIPVDSYRDADGKEYDIVVRLPAGSQLSRNDGTGDPSLDDFGRLYIGSVTGAQVPLLQLASLEFKSSPTYIHHYNLDRAVTVTGDAIRGYSVDQVTRSIIAALDAYDWQPGYGYVVSGELESRDESFGGLGQAILIAIIAIVGVLVLQFRSFTQPLIIFAALPLAIVGAILALLMTGYTFSFTAFVGLASLVGIVINNSIILVDYTNQLRAQGKELVEAIKEAGETRFLPIVMTTATTVAGLLPLTLRGGTIWAPMGWTIIGGLIASTFLTLIIVPVLYKVFSGRTAE